MMADIPEADVVLVNPTHVAIALRYDAERGAPRVVARGAGAIARKIREKAAESGVPLVRDVPLARALYSSTQVGQEIPPGALRRRRPGARVRDHPTHPRPVAAASTAARAPRPTCPSYRPPADAAEAFRQMPQPSPRSADRTGDARTASSRCHGGRAQHR